MRFHYFVGMLRHSVSYSVVPYDDCRIRGIPSQSCPFGSEFSGASDIHYFLQSRKSYFGGNNSVLYYVACPSMCCFSAVLSRLLDTIARVSNDKLT